MRVRRIKKKWLIFLIAAILVLAAVTIILNTVVRQQIRRQLQSLSPAIQINYSAVHSNLLMASISFDELKINFIPYNSRQQNKHALHFSHATIKGINFFKLLLSKKFSANRLHLEKANILLDSFLLKKKDSAQAEIIEQIKTPFKTIGIRHLELATMKICLDSLGLPLVTGDLAVHEIEINKQETGRDQIRFAGIDFNLFDLNYSLPDNSGLLHIQKLMMNSRNAMLQVDSLQITQGNAGDHPSIPQDNIEANIPSIQVTKPDMMNLLQNKLVAEEIFIPKGKMKIYNPGIVSSSGAKLPVSINVKSFHADDLSVVYRDREQEINFKAAFNVDDGELHIKKGDFSYAGIRSNLSDIHYTSFNGHHNVAIKKIAVDTKEEIVRINDLKLVPKYGKYEFGRKVGHQADRIDADVPEIVIQDPEFNGLFKGKLVAEKILVGEGKFHIFRDRRLPKPQKKILLPVAFFKTLPVDIRVKTCELAASYVEYEEYPSDGFGQQTGILRIERARATLSPFISHPLASDPDHLTMHASGSFMGSGTMQGTVIMPLKSNKPYHITGIIENLELTKLNLASENLGKVRIKSGFLDFLSFDFQMDDERSTGKIIAAYHRLIMQQLEKHADKKNVARFSSFMLRHLIIPLNKDKSVPEKKRTGKVNYVRDPTRFVAHYFLQSLLMGIKKSFALGFLLPK